MDNVEVLDNQVSVNEENKIDETQEKEVPKKEEKEAEELDVVGKQSVQNPQAEGTGNSQVRSQIQQTLESTGKYGKEKDDNNYTAMKEGLKKLDTQLNESVSKETMLVSWRDLRKTYLWIASAAEQYVNTHKVTYSSSGRSRRRHARALLNLCKSDVMRLNMVIQSQDTIEPQSTWKQLLDKKPANANNAKLSVQKLIDNKDTAGSMSGILKNAGFQVMTKEQFLVMSGRSMDQIPEKYRDILPLLDTYLEKLTLGPKGKMQLNDDSQGILGQIWSLADMYIDDKKKNRAAMAEGQEFAEAKLTFTMQMLKRQCEKVLNPEQNAPVTSPADRLHGPLPMPGKVNEEKELEELTKDTSKKEVPGVQQPENPKVVKEEPKPQPENPKVVKEEPKPQPENLQQQQESAQAENKPVDEFSRTGFRKIARMNIASLTGEYLQLGALLDAYGTMISNGQADSEQGRDALIANLKKIRDLTGRYLDTQKRTKRNFRVRFAMVHLKIQAIEKLEAIEPQQPENQEVVDPKPQPENQKVEEPEPKPEKQEVEESKQQTENQEVEEPKPKLENQEVVKTEPKPQPENLQQQQESAADQSQQQGASQTEEQQKQEQGQEQQQEQEQQQDSEPAGPSLRRDLLGLMKAEVDGLSDDMQKEDYTKLIEQLENLIGLLEMRITEENRAESWKNIQDTYNDIAAYAEYYARANAGATSMAGKESRRHARMLRFLCSFDMKILQKYNSDQELEKKILTFPTWNHLLDRKPDDTSRAKQKELQEMQDASLQDHPKGNPARDFRNWGRALRRSEKGGIGRNSKYFNSVQNALMDTASVMDQGFNDIPRDNMKNLTEAVAALRALQAACQEYIARNPYTESGKIRRDIVLKIEKFAAKDALGCEKAITDFAGMEPKDQAEQTWTSVVQKARSVQITVKDFSKLQSPGGGQASEIVKIESKEGGLDVAKYFKKEDSLDMDLVKEKGYKAPRYIAKHETWQKYPGLTEEEKETIKTLQPGSTDKLIASKLSSEEGREAAKYYTRRLKQLDTSIYHIMQPLGIEDEGGMANMSRRNVATSRIAGLLGLGKLVAKSDTAEIYDEATGKTIRGNLMDQAEGEEYDKIKDKLQQSEITSGFMRDIMNLQVLDMLCGQVDRHAGNMLYKIENGKISGIQGIDNDASFGTNTDAVSGKDGERKDAKVIDDQTGEMAIPYMDDELAVRIEELKGEVVRYVLKDLLKGAEIDATIFRLNVMKKGIKKARIDHPERFLKGEDAWTLIKKAEEQPKQEPEKEEQAKEEQAKQEPQKQEPEKKEPEKKEPQKQEQTKENQSSVQQDLMNQYKYAMFQSDVDAKENSQIVMQTAREMFKDDPKTVEALSLMEFEPKEFKEKYTEDEQKKFGDVRKKVREVCKVKLKKRYYGSMNYFGRIMSE